MLAPQATEVALAARSEVEHELSSSGGMQNAPHAQFETSPAVVLDSARDIQR